MMYIDANHFLITMEYVYNLKEIQGSFVRLNE